MLLFPVQAEIKAFKNQIYESFLNQNKYFIEPSRSYHQKNCPITSPKHLRQNFPITSTKHLRHLPRKTVLDIKNPDTLGSNTLSDQ